MSAVAQKIILKSANWTEFELELEKLGSAPKFKKLKGEAFEQLTKCYLKIDPLYRSMFENVWHHSELPINVKDELKLPSPEIGVDLVAQNTNGTYCAIQCKFHQDRTQNVTYNELSTFFSVTERAETYQKIFHRLICTSANEIAKRVRQLHPEKLGFLCANEFQKLDDIAFDEIHSLIRGDHKTFIPFSPRSHQLTAIEKTNKYFTFGHNKGKIIHPCGSGKSLTAYWIARDLNVKSILISVPSLALVKQTLSAWTREAIANQTKMEWIAVCSDQDVSINDDPSYQSHDLGIAVTTDINAVASFLLQSTEAMKVVITTYQSSEVTSAAVNSIKYEFDLGIFDEAHKTAGHKSKKFSHLISDENVPTKKKIFMTATERQFRGDSTDFLSMDDQQIYGEVIDQLSFKRALEQKPQILCDYKIITVIVTKNEIEKVLIKNELTSVDGGNYSFESDSSTIAALFSLKKLARERNIRHAISFHSSIKRAEQFRDINDKINLRSNSLEILNAYHVSGKNSTGERHAEINRFLANSPSVIANARCLTEGVDIPEIDAVVFSDPKQSVIDIVQAAGRAMRTHEQKALGYIVIPVILENDQEDTVHDAFRQLIAVIAALGINDDRIIEEAKQYVGATVKGAGKILEFVEYAPTTEIDFAELVHGLEIKIWDRLSFAKSVIGESKFAKWMTEHTSLSPKTIKNYNQAVRKISNDLVKLKMAYSSLEDITEKADLKQLKLEYFSIAEYR